MTWKPSLGLLRAEPIVQTLLADAAAVGIHVTNPAYRWRMKQVIAEALDHALADGSAAQRNAPDLPDFPPSAGDELPYTNGHHEVADSAWTPFDPVAVGMETLTTYQPIVQDPSVVTKEIITGETASAPVKRGRGRPKGSTGKKKKAARARARAAQEAKPAAAAEAPPAEVPES